MRGNVAGTTPSECSARSPRPGSRSSPPTPRRSSPCVSSPTTSRRTWVNHAGTRPSARTTRPCPRPSGTSRWSSASPRSCPNYSGGLGVLAGDHLKAASDLGVPLVAVGLLYRSGYFRQSLALDGWQVETYPVLDPQGLPLHLLTDDSGEPLLVTVNMPGGRVLSARVWRAAVGRVPLLLLDSDIEENDADLRGVTDRLYGGDQNHRIRQEILVGIGGVRAVRAFCAASGHPAPERVPHQRGARGLPGPGAHPGAARRRGARLRRGAGRGARGHGLHHAHAGARRHRPVPARHGAPLLRRLREVEGTAARRAEPTGCSRSAPRTTRACSTWRTWACAWPSGRTASRSCTARCRAGMFGGLWSGFDTDEVPIGSVTNGVHGQTWEAREVAGADRASPRRPRRAPRRGAVGRRAVGPADDPARPAGRARCAAGCGRRGCSAVRPCRSWAGPSTSSTPTCSPSASRGACRPTSGSR